MTGKVHTIIILSFASILALAGCEIQRPAPAPEQPTAPAAPGPTVEPGQAVFNEVPLPAPAGPDDFVPGQVLVKFRPETTSQAFSAQLTAEGTVTTNIATLNDALQKFGVAELQPVLSPNAQALGQNVESLSAQVPNVGRLFVAKLPPADDQSAAGLDAYNQKTRELQQALDADPSTEYAELNFLASISGEPFTLPQALVPNDPFFQNQWNFHQIQMERAWDVSTGEGVVVAVLDTGVAYENFDRFRQAPDLSGTRFLPGYDFINNDQHANDDQGHGTHVAGTIAQTTNNGQGTTGIAFNATIMPVKILDQNGQGSYDAIVQGITFAVNSGAKVINLSLAGGSFSNALRDAVQFARQRGVLVVAATGNRGGNVEYPAALDGVLAVGSVRFSGARAPYSNFGPQVDIVAPGGDTGVDENGDDLPDGILQETFRNGQVTNFEFLLFQGTSMATPHVSGVAALLLSRVPGASPDQLENAIITSAKDLGAAGRDDQTGYGLIQAADALAALGVTPPPTPTLTPVPGVTPSPTPTPQPGATSTPVPAGELLLNGGFEGDEGWIFGKTVIPGGYVTEPKKSGQRAVRLGIVDGGHVFSFSSVWQKVTIPAEAKSANLTAWLFPVSQDTADTDRQIVLILNHRFQPLQFLQNDLSNEAAWVQRSYDVSAYRGQTIYVYFGVVNRGAATRSGMYVDDVSLTWAR